MFDSRLFVAAFYAVEAGFHPMFSNIDAAFVNGAARFMRASTHQIDECGLELTDPVPQPRSAWHDDRLALLGTFMIEVGTNRRGPLFRPYQELTSDIRSVVKGRELKRKSRH